MAKKNNGVSLPTTEPQLEQPEKVVHAPLEMDNDALTLVAATVFASRVGIGDGQEGASRRQQAIEWSVQVAYDLAQAVADKRNT